MRTSEPADRATALVLFSGGQDSTTCLAWALDRYAHVETVGFDYGQRHRIELDVRAGIIESLRRDFEEWGTRLGDDHVVQLRFDQVTASALLYEGDQPRPRADGLPATFVPGRNLLFLTYSSIIAEGRGLKHIVIGACETDYSGYPDCRDDTVKALQIAVNLGMQTTFSFETPLMHIDKAETWNLAHHLGGNALTEIIREQTHTCYAGLRDVRHAWGYGCEVCDACILRARGWQGFVAHALSR